MIDRHSIINFTFSISSNLMIWLFKKHTIVAISPSKVEYMRLSTTSKEATWLAKST